MILSIVPPRDALATARRVDAASKKGQRTRDKVLYFVDLNAIAPSSSRSIRDLFQEHGNQVRYVDGGIIGGPPRFDEAAGTWSRLSILLSGPFELSSVPIWGEQLYSALGGKHLGPEIGSASGFKCCFASLTKGFASLAIQSYSTAAQLGVLSPLREHLADVTPGLKGAAERLIIDMPPKAYRWVDEMREIGKTFKEDGHWRAEQGGGIFDSVADLYTFVADETVLGEEKVDNRKRKTVDDVVDGLSDGLKKAKHA